MSEPPPPRSLGSPPGKRAKRPRCPRCGRKMYLSDVPVTLPEEGGQAEPPIWLCQRCWVVLPIDGERLHIVRPAARRAKPSRRRSSQATRRPRAS